MIHSSCDSQSDRCSFVVRPNQSLNWRQAKIFVLLLSIPVLGIAIGFSLVGLWPILPFAGLELAGVWVALYIGVLRNRKCQVITVESDQVFIEKGNYQPEHSWKFNRSWTKVSLIPGQPGTYPARLLIRSHGKRIEVGEFLNEEERRELAINLEDAIQGSYVT